MIRGTHPHDAPLIEELLTEASLPLEGIGEHLATFLVAEQDGNIIGVMGLELYGGTALLRSAAVRPSERGKGVGTELYRRILALAKDCGVRRLILLTDTAEKYFARKGFRVIDRNVITGPITRSAEFAGACPGLAVAMELEL
jgi:amino-acid N-acetyltransferase